MKKEKITVVAVFSSCKGHNKPLILLTFVTIELNKPLKIPSEGDEDRNREQVILPFTGSCLKNDFLLMEQNQCTGKPAPAPTHSCENVSENLSLPDVWYSHHTHFNSAFIKFPAIIHF